jgi:hypothetical protein
MDRHAAIGMIGRSNRHHKMVVRFQGRTSDKHKSSIRSLLTLNFQTFEEPQLLAG